MSGWGEEYTQPLNEPGSGRGDRMSGIGTDMRKVSRKITQLRKEAGMIGTARDSHELRTQIHRTREEATKTMKQAAAALRESQSDPKIRGDPDQRSALNQLESDFEQLHQLYASVLEETQRKMRDNVLTSDSVPHSQAGGGALDRALQTSDSDVQIQFQEFGEVDAEIMRENEEEAEQIARDATVLRDLYRDIQQHVAEQGESLQEMEHNMEGAVDKAEGATRHLDKAADSMFAYRRKCCYFWSCIITVLAVVIGYLVYHFTNKN